MHVGKQITLHVEAETEEVIPVKLLKPTANCLTYQILEPYTYELKQA